MIKRQAVGIVIIFGGILVFLAGLREFLLVLFIEQIPLIGDVIRLIAPTALQEQLIYILGGIVLLFVGGIVARRKKT